MMGRESKHVQRFDRYPVLRIECIIGKEVRVVRDETICTVFPH